MIARYWSSLVSIRRCADSWLTSPSAITAEARLRILSTFSDPSSTITSNARLNRKSPTSTGALLPQIMFAVLRPRQIGRAHVCTPFTTAPLVCLLLLEKHTPLHTIHSILFHRLIVSRQS